MDDVLGQRRLGRQEGRVVVAAQQQVELVQLAALALPAHPAAFGLVVEAPAVEQMETRAAGDRVAFVEPGDLAACVVEHLEVVRRLLDVAVRPVGKQREKDVAAHIGEEMHFEIAQALVDVVARADQRGHHDQRARIGGDAALELVADQPGWLERQQQELVEHAQARFSGRQRAAGGSARSSRRRRRHCRVRRRSR